MKDNTWILEVMQVILGLALAFWMGFAFGKIYG